ncbi:hypothetical protein F2P56_023537 [Juglans regia]|uniref:Uncharacterized protein n=1 Tax=Juglans regia TaxID=51240 RepID=A0A833WKE8_JUGRE|nr:hypothetical protein F2P56_023537 [Juglans regia]
MRHWQSGESLSELIRSMHVYQLENGKENEVERGFLFSVSGSYMEIEANPALFLLKFRPSEVFEGLMNGFWLCIFAYHADHSPHLTCIPSLLSISRYTIIRILHLSKLSSFFCLSRFEVPIC